jgi:ABC-type bacteriocin/lantibiotic exporter with double-glycine peptidase domain
VKLLALSVAAIFFSCGQGLSAPPRKAQAGKSSATADESQICGRNALYMLLRLNGIDCSLDEVSRVTPVGLAGTTLTELKQTAAHFRLPCDMIKTDIETLERSKAYPCIVLTEGGGLIPDANGNPIPGHYWVLTEFSPTGDTLAVIDGTYGLPGRYTRKRFRERWTGFALVPRRDRSDRIGWAVTCLNAAFWVFAMKYSRKGADRTMTARNEKQGP